MRSVTQVTIVTMLLATIAQAKSPDEPASCLKGNAAYATDRLSDSSAQGLPGQPLLRFAQLSDVHVYDDDASSAVNGAAVEPVLEPGIANGSAQRLQDEFTDEVLNAMISTINACGDADEIALMIATGDNTDTMTLNEVRRFIDNLDGVTEADTAYEANCGYLPNDSNENPKLGGALPCPAELGDAFAIPTGKLVADAQTTPVDPESPIGQFAPVRSPYQLLTTAADSLVNGSFSIAPGLPGTLRCNAGEADCENHRLGTPYFAVFGNHDGAIRGTLTMNQTFQPSTLAQGRYFLESQREWINEFFHSTPEPGPLGHGFQFAGDRLEDPDDRNDGYYVFGVKQNRDGSWTTLDPSDEAAYATAQVRMIVLNTLYDGVRSQLGPGGPVLDLHMNGATNATTQGLVAGNEATNPIGLEGGVLPTEQYDWLASELASAAAAKVPVLVFSHHPDRSFTDRRLGFAADGGATSTEFDQLLGKAAHGGEPSTLVAHIAGHTHENVVRKCTPAACPFGREPAEGDPVVERAFWRIETASLIDYPQEARIVELFDLCEAQSSCHIPAARRYALRLTMISPDPSDEAAALSHDLSIAEATCNLSQMLGGPLSSGPYDQTRLETIVDNAGEAAVRQKFCFGEASLAAAEGRLTDRDVTLLP
ncbi:MAG: hypothetical protein ACREQJ_06640 [Candidatus Binatia bacterium]